MNHVCSEQDPLTVALKRVGIGDIWFSIDRDWSLESCHGNGITDVNRIIRQKTWEKNANEEE